MLTEPTAGSALIQACEKAGATIPRYFLTSELQVDRADNL